MKTGKSCNRCGVGLIIGDNWSEGLAKSRSYMCRPCNSEKGKIHYANNAQKYLDMQRERLKTKEGGEKRKEYSSKFYEKNIERWNTYRDTQRKKEESDSWVRAGRMLIWIRARAGKKQFDFDLTREWIEEKLKKGICEVTGKKFDLKRNKGERFNPWCPSVDRIDPLKGYLKENCRVVVWIYNMAKSEWNDQIVFDFAEALVTERAKNGNEKTK